VFRLLNLGCGIDIREGYHNVDLYADCDERVDLRNIPWPWQDETFDELLAQDIVEHFPDTIAFMNECHRILSPGGTVFIRTPSYDAAFAWTDPTHVKVTTIDTWDFFDPETDFGKQNIYLTPHKWKIISKVKTENHNLEIELRKR